MFGFEEKCETLYAPISGKIFKIEEAADTVFSHKIMGEGFATAVDGSQIFAPVTGTVTLVQRHAVGLIRSDGLEVLLYLKVECPYKFTIIAGDNINGGEKIGQIDLVSARHADSAKTVMIVFTNTTDKLTDFTVDYRETAGGDVIGRANVKR
ncbi:PTS glucose transporter subunit IIA [Lactovum odontotermitis]